MKEQHVVTPSTRYLDSNKVAYVRTSHRTVFTAYDLAQTLHVPLNEIAKTLLVKAKDAYYLVMLRASDRLDLAKLKLVLSAKSIRIAEEKDMVRELKVKPGALTPFGGLHMIAVVVDKKLAAVRSALFPSGNFEHSLRMKLRDFIKLERPIIGLFSVHAGLKLQPVKKPIKRTAKKHAKRSAEKRTTKRRR